MADIPSTGQLPFDILKYLKDPGLIVADIEKITKQSVQTATQSAVAAKSASDDAKKSAEDMTAAAKQTANATKIRIDTVLSSILSSNLANPTAGD